MATVEAMLASVSYVEVEIILAVICFLIFLYFCKCNGLPRNWPLIGMLPVLFPLTLHLYDHLTQIILELYDGTFVFKGLWFANRDMILTADWQNVKHILSTNFSSYPKGPDTKKIFGICGEILFTSDLDIWRRDRKLVHTFLRNRRLHDFCIKINQEILEKGLIPILDHASKDKMAIDLQDVFQRYMLDATCMMITGHNRGSLRVGFPKDAVLNALHDASDAIFWRHILPESFWKLQEWLGIGVEKKLTTACKILDDAAVECIKTWENQETRISEYSREPFDAISYFYNEKELVESFGLSPGNILKDISKGLVFAGTDTISSVLPWFFWLLSKNPIVECKIRKELESDVYPTKSGAKCLFFHAEEDLNKLTYLHAALCETLRLFPSAPFLPRTCIKHDILPSGHSVKPSTRLILCTYAMGRMKSLWGGDCLEFKPERWILERGGLKPVASSIFLAFSSGPRTCMGKEVAFNRLKAIAATILYNYQIQIAKNQPAPTPATSIFLRMKHGLLVNVVRRPAEFD